MKTKKPNQFLISSYSLCLSLTSTSLSNQIMEQTEESTNTNQKFTTKRRNFSNGTNNNNNNSHEHHNHHHQYYYHQQQQQHHHQLLQQHSTQLSTFYNYQNKYQRYYPALLPLPTLIPFQQLPFIPPFHQNQNFKSKTHLQKLPCKLNSSPSSDYNLSQPPPLVSCKLQHLFFLFKLTLFSCILVFLIEMLKICSLGLLGKKVPKFLIVSFYFVMYF